MHFNNIFVNIIEAWERKEKGQDSPYIISHDNLNWPYGPRFCTLLLSRSMFYLIVYTVESYLKTEHIWNVYIPRKLVYSKHITFLKKLLNESATMWLFFNNYWIWNKKNHIPLTMWYKSKALLQQCKTIYHKVVSSSFFLFFFLKWQKVLWRKINRLITNLVFIDMIDSVQNQTDQLNPFNLKLNQMELYR